MEARESPKMASIDMTHRKLNFPPRFLPYLEKHRIFELFHECIELLIQIRPKDHIQFLRSVLPCAAMKKDKQRIVFLAPPSFDRETFANLVADCMDIKSISRMYLETLARDRLKSDEVRILEIPESTEELSTPSCICLPEDNWTYPYIPETHYSSFGEEQTILGETISEASKVVEEEQPCICVCPCVKETEEEAASGKREAEEVAKEEEVSEEEDWEDREWEGEELACVPIRKVKKEKKYRPVSSFFSPVESTSEIEVDYGILTECSLATRGWILQDFPMTGEESEDLIKLGVIPTHAIRIIIDEKKEMEDRDYKWTIIKWTNAYKFVPVTEIRLDGRSIEKLALDMCKLLSGMPHRHAPMVPRVVLIGSRGSGVTTQGKNLAQKFNIVHVEFDVVKARALLQDDPMSKLYQQQLQTRPDPEVEAVVLEKVLLSTACRKRGWVLTGYPKNVDQMRMLDIIATPPNRVIFVEVPARECFVRLHYRKFDPCFGDEYKIPDIVPSGVDGYKTKNVKPEVAERLLSHPKNDKKQVIHDIESYFLEKEDMMEYCGKTASYVDGNKPEKAVFEMIEQIIINATPPHPPRNPLSINHGIDESHDRLKKFRLTTGLFLNNLLLNPPERAQRY